MNTERRLDLEAGIKELAEAIESFPKDHAGRFKPDAQIAFDGQLKSYEELLRLRKVKEEELKSLPPS